MNMTEQTPPIATKIGLLLHRLVADNPDSKLSDFDRNLLDDLLIEVAGTSQGVGIGKAMKVLRVHAGRLRSDVCETVGVSEYSLAMMEREPLLWTREQVGALLSAIR